MRTIVICGLALAIYSVNIVAGRPPLPDPKATQPNAEQLTAAKDAYAKLGAKYERLDVEGIEPPFHLFRMPETTTDADLKRLPDLPFHFLLSLGGTKITDDGLKELKSLKKLIGLNLAGTKVTDAGMKDIKELKDLFELCLYDTKVTMDGVKQVKDALPKCHILQ